MLFQSRYELEAILVFGTAIVDRRSIFIATPAFPASTISDLLEVALLALDISESVATISATSDLPAVLAVRTATLRGYGTYRSRYDAVSAATRNIFAISPTAPAADAALAASIPFLRTATTRVTILEAC